ncbi:MAG: transglycosylase SLT domain-containing protein [Lautropia sp.]
MTIASSNATEPSATAPAANARRSRLLALQLPCLVGLLAAAGAVTQLDASASAVAAEHSVGIRAPLPVERTDWAALRQALPAGAIGSVAAPAAIVEASASPAIAANAAVASAVAGDVDPGEDERIVASAADRIRHDPMQTAPVPLPPVSVIPRFRLDAQQRVIARHIAQTYRIAGETIDRFVFLAYKVATEMRLDPHLLLAVMAVESSFNPYAESGAGAQGLMQVHTRVHAQKFDAFGGIEAAWDPLANIKVGARILNEYLVRYGDLPGALKAYVGAALREHDGGYGQKVLGRAAEFGSVIRNAGGTVGSLAAPGRGEAAKPRVSQRSGAAVGSAG